MAKPTITGGGSVVNKKPHRTSHLKLVGTNFNAMLDPVTATYTKGGKTYTWKGDGTSDDTKLATIRLVLDSVSPAPIDIRTETGDLIVTVTNNMTHETSDPTAVKDVIFISKDDL